ncbi:MAG: hypothetical protein IJT09_00510, partial [Abditibacteriota bacterium]|nr:hypothetical protein [Abditibacteriota bacterium]
QDDPTDPNASASHSFTLKLAAGDTVDVSSYSKAAPWNSIALVRQFTVTEVADQPETASSVADIKALEDGDTVITEFDLVALNDKGFFDDSSVYASAEDRLAVVRLDFSGVDNLVTAGDRVRVKGTVGTDAGGKYITVTEVTSSESGEKLLALATTKGTVDTGVLVRVWGKVVSKADGTFVLNNGSGDVTVIGTTDKAVGGFVTVTGIATETGVKAMEVL